MVKHMGGGGAEELKYKNGPRRPFSPTSPTFPVFLSASLVFSNFFYLPSSLDSSRVAKIRWLGLQMLTRDSRLFRSSNEGAARELQKNRYGTELLYPLHPNTRLGGPVRMLTVNQFLCPSSLQYAGGVRRAGMLRTGRCGNG